MSDVVTGPVNGVRSAAVCGDVVAACVYLTVVAAVGLRGRLCRTRRWYGLALDLAGVLVCVARGGSRDGDGQGRDRGAGAWSAGCRWRGGHGRRGGWAVVEVNGLGLCMSATHRCWPGMDVGVKPVAGDLRRGAPDGRSGDLLFQGGVTGSRGHAGETLVPTAPTGLRLRAAGPNLAPGVWLRAGGCSPMTSPWWTTPRGVRQQAAATFFVAFMSLRASTK